MICLTIVMMLQSGTYDVSHWFLFKKTKKQNNILLIL